MKKTELNDTDLIKAFRNGDESAFEHLVFRHKNRMFSAVLLIVRDRNLAEDLLQEAFVKIVRCLREGRYNEEGKFLPWALRIARNMAIDHTRRKKRNGESSIEDQQPGWEATGPSEEIFDQKEIQDLHKTYLKELIETLPDAQREVLMMRHFAEMSFQEIADLTGVSINTALGRMRYALQNLRKQIEQNQHHYEELLHDY